MTMFARRSYRFGAIVVVLLTMVSISSAFYPQPIHCGRKCGSLSSRMSSSLTMSWRPEESEPSETDASSSSPSPSQLQEQAQVVWNGLWNEVGDMWRQMDLVVDDFFNKRMGNGEVFYGKRKYKPSGSVEGQYNGMGHTDKSRIELARIRQEIRMQRIMDDNDNNEE